MNPYSLMESRSSCRAARWEHFDHGADVGVRGVGPTKEAAFEQIAVALTATITDPAAVRPLPEEIEYLRETYRRYFPRRDDRPLQSFAGVRVLPLERGAVFHRTRETLLAADDARAPRLITIYGGKLTGYRLTAARALRRFAAALPARSPRADTASLRLNRE